MQWMMLCFSYRNCLLNVLIRSIIHSFQSFNKSHDKRNSNSKGSCRSLPKKIDNLFYLFYRSVEISLKSIRRSTSEIYTDFFFLTEQHQLQIQEEIAKNFRTQLHVEKLNIG